METHKGIQEQTTNGKIIAQSGNLYQRKHTAEINVGGILIGGGSPVTVQSMTNTDTRDVEATLDQIRKLADAGCDIVRIAVPDMEAAGAIPAIKAGTSLPVVADIHFDYRLALESIKNGADKIRINPGNIGDSEKLGKVAAAAKAKGIPIRVGVNSGSLEKMILEKYHGVTAEGLAESAVLNTEMLAGMGFEDIVVSAKASDVSLMIETYRILSVRTSYPLHIGVTEAGTPFAGLIKSCAGIGTLLAEGIGDTIRMSLTGDPSDEVKAGIELIKALGLRKGGIKLISCPTCGRCRINLVEIAAEVEKRLVGVEKELKVAIMGCAVNGPGEAREADIGIAGGDGCALLFKKGRIVRKIREDRIVEELMDEIRGF